MIHVHITHPYNVSITTCKPYMWWQTSTLAAISSSLFVCCQFPDAASCQSVREQQCLFCIWILPYDTFCWSDGFVKAEKYGNDCSVKVSKNKGPLSRVSGLYFEQKKSCKFSQIVNFTVFKNPLLVLSKFREPGYLVCILCQNIVLQKCTFP